MEQILSENPPSAFGEVKKLSERLGQLNQEIDRATERWLELAELVG
ncbi:ABC transporter C-terminal domain-containing protein [Microcoleus sp. LEGE 07076]